MMWRDKRKIPGGYLYRYQVYAVTNTRFSEERSEAINAIDIEFENEIVNVWIR